MEPIKTSGTSAWRPTIWFQACTAAVQPPPTEAISQTSGSCRLSGGLIPVVLLLVLGAGSSFGQTLEEQVRAAYLPQAKAEQFLHARTDQLIDFHKLMTGLHTLARQHTRSIPQNSQKFVPYHALAKRLGFQISSTDQAILLHELDRRGRGYYAIRYGVSGRLAIQAPHSRNDKHTEIIGARLFTAGIGRVFHASTISRWTVPAVAPAKQGAADLCHNDRNYFHVASMVFAEQIADAVVLQLHGYDHLKHPGLEVDHAVLSNGTRQPGAFCAALELAFEKSWNNEFAIYGRETKTLGATTNTQGQMLRRMGATFLHVEFSLHQREQLLKDPRLFSETVRILDNVLTPTKPKP